MGIDWQVIKTGMETSGWYWSGKCDSFYFVESHLSERASCPPRKRMLDDPFMNHLHLFDRELDLWWHSETPFIPTISFALFCDLTQVMTRSPVSDKICDVNELYIAYTPIIIYSPHPSNYICIHIVVGYAWKCTEWLLTRTEENMWVLGWMCWNWLTKQRYYLQLFPVSDK